MCNTPEPSPAMKIMLAHGNARFDLAPDGKRLVFMPELKAKLEAAGLLADGQAWVDNCNSVMHGPAK